MDRDLGRGMHTRSRGTSAVEFALVGPTAFLLLIGAVVLGIIVTHEIQHKSSSTYRLCFP